MAALLAVGAVAQMPPNGTQWIRNVTLTSFDGVFIHLDASIPYPPPAPGVKIPLVIFPTSWGSREFEYLYYNWNLAASGYVAIEYLTRGWYGSNGYIEVASPADVADALTVIDWAIARFEFVDATRVGMMGISYGAGISLLVAANDSRVTTVCALSGWASLEGSLWWGESPSLVWGSILFDVGKILGRPDPELLARWFDMLHYNDVNATIEWGRVRSPNAYLDRFAGKAVYVSNNYEDNIFHSHHALAFWEALPTPHKRLSLSQGIHASAELGGLRLWGNYIFETATKWLDHFLRGVPNGIDAPPLVDMQVDAYGDFSTRHTFATWPRPGVPPTQSLWLSPRPTADFALPHYGALSATPPVAADLGTSAVAFSPLLTTFNAGTPVVGNMFKVFVRIPIMHETRLALPGYDYVFRGDPLAAESDLCGAASLSNMTVVATAARASVYAYLYDEEPLTGVAMLMTHAPVSVWEGLTPGVPYLLPPLNFRAGCYRIAAGHRMLVVLNLHCALYEPAHANTTDVTVAVDFAASWPAFTFPTPIPV